MNAALRHPHPLVGEPPAHFRATLDALTGRGDPRSVPACWQRDPGIQAYGLARRSSGGRVTPDWALKVYVVDKRPRRGMRAPIPSQIDVGFGMVPLDVEAIGRLRTQQGLAPGASAVCNAGSVDTRRAAGTLSCLLRPREPRSERRYLLSCAHVLAPPGANRHDPVWLLDGDDGHVPIGRLSAWSTLGRTAGARVAVDAAVAEITSSSALTRLSREIADIGMPASRHGNGTLRRGQHLRMRGAASQRVLTLEVVDLAFRLAEPVGALGNPFTRQHVDAVACLCHGDAPQDGDSGAAVVDAHNDVVGVHSLAAPTAEPGKPHYTAFSRIGPILHHFATQWLLDLEIDTVLDSVQEERILHRSS